MKPSIGYPPMPLKRLRASRLKKALTQEDLAKLAGVSRQTVTRLENGDPNVSPGTLRKLAKALKVRPNQLLD
jgi:transcriptional regulator with XRE-family HTH domain